MFLYSFGVQYGITNTHSVLLLSHCNRRKYKSKSIILSISIKIVMLPINTFGASISKVEEHRPEGKHQPTSLRPK